MAATWISLPSSSKAARGTLSSYDSLLYTCRTIWEYILSDNARNKRNFSIGVATVFLVVSFLSLLENALYRSNIVFIRLAEEQTGAFDLLLLPDVSANTPPFLNYTLVNQTLQDIPSINGVSPRWIFRANISNAQEADESTTSASLMIMDSMWEKEIGLAPLWPYRTLGPQEGHVAASLLRALKVEPEKGQRILMRINLASTVSDSSLTSGSAAANTTEAFLPIQSLLSNIPANRSVSIPKESFALLPPETRSLMEENFNIKSTDDVFIFNTNDVIQLLNSQNIVVTTALTVVDAIEQTFGKYPSSLGNVIVIEKSFAQNLLQVAFGSLFDNFLFQSAAGNLVPQTQSLMSSIDLNSYCMSAAVVLKGRYKIYTEDSDTRDAVLITQSNIIMQRLGLDLPVKLLDVLNQAVIQLDFIRIFLNEIFFTVLVVLVILAAVLISSLLVADAEEKTFEFGILRTLGLEQKYVVMILILQSLMFSIPGIVCGLLVSFLLYVPIGYLLAIYSGADFDMTIEPSALLLGILLGLFLPVIGITLPIRRALTRTIRDALDVYHNVVYDTQIKIQKLQDIGLSINQITVSLVLVIGGFLVYYLIPLSFIFNRLDFFFRIMTIVLLMMVLGQLFIGQMLQSILQRAAVYLMTFVLNDKKLTQIVCKNLAGHRRRNQKTALMFTLCVGYLIFAATMFSMQTRSLKQQIEWFYGADVVVTAPSFSLPLPETKLRDFMTTVLVNETNPISVYRIVDDYTFVTFGLDTFDSIINLNTFPLASISMPRVSVFGVERNFLRVVNPNYVMVSETNPKLSTSYLDNGLLDIISPLYNNISNPNMVIPPFSLTFGSLEPSVDSEMFFNEHASDYINRIPIILSEALRTSAFITSTSLVYTSIEYYMPGLGKARKNFLSELVAMVKKLPFFPKINQLQTSGSSVIMSVPSYQTLVQYLNRYSSKSVLAVSGTDLPFGSLLIKINSDAKALQIESVVNQLNSLLSNDNYKVFNVRAQLSTTDSASFFINMVFIIVAMVGIILSFFVLWLSFNANVRENSWELGVLRAIGLDTGSVARIYIFEACSIVLASIIIGSLLGILTSIALTLQFNLFTEMPFKLDFPLLLFFMVAILSVLLAIIGSYLPTVSFNKSPIAIVLRGGSTS